MCVREREAEREKDIYIYINKQREREKERDIEREREREKEKETHAQCTGIVQEGLNSSNVDEKRRESLGVVRIERGHCQSREMKQMCE